MSNPNMISCAACGRQYNSAVLKKCPACASISVQKDFAASQAAPAPSHSIQSPPPPIPTELWTPSKLQFAVLAGKAARTVDAYGLVIQILGYISAGFTFLYMVFGWGADNDEMGVGFIVGLVAGLFVAWINQVIGALYRMIANYVLFRTSQ